MTNEKTSFICQQNDTGKYGCVNAQGEVIIPFEYDILRVFGRENDTMWLEVVKDGKYNIIDLEGKYF